MSKNGQPYLKSRGEVLRALRHGPIACLDMRRQPWKFSANPAERVRELRLNGHDIGTIYSRWEYHYVLFEKGKPVWNGSALQRAYEKGAYRWGVNGRPAAA